MVTGCIITNQFCLTQEMPFCRYLPSDDTLEIIEECDDGSPVVLRSSMSTRKGAINSVLELLKKTTIDRYPG